FGDRKMQSGSIYYRTPDGVVVQSRMRDSTSVKGLQPRSYQILDAMAAGGKAAGVTHIMGVGGRGGGHKSQQDGTEKGIVGYQANGQIWTDEQRAAMGRAGQKGGANRFGLYEGGSGGKTLHIGYAHQGSNGKYFPAAVWGGNGGATSIENGAHQF